MEFAYSFAAILRDLANSLSQLLFSFISASETLKSSILFSSNRFVYLANALSPLFFTSKIIFLTFSVIFVLFCLSLFINLFNFALNNYYYILKF